MSKDNKVDELLERLLEDPRIYSTPEARQKAENRILTIDETKALLFKLISEEVINGTEMIFTNDLPSLLQQEEIYEIRKHHKAEQMKALERLFGDE